ncbi:MAG: LysR family transcriptional regulator [Treponema sp.]|nr:LysR family transcriptional regulator [Treponema sp.]
MDFIQLQYFKTLAEYEHMTHAANALHVVQPALSRMLRNLERDLGIRLFERNGKNIRLNENGRIFLGHANSILGEIEEARSVLAEKAGAGERRVRLSVGAASGLLPRIIRGFSKSHPDIALTLVQPGPSAGTFPDQCDILVDSSLSPPERANCDILLKEEILLAIPVSHPLSDRESVRLIEVAQAPFLSLWKGSGLRMITDACCMEVGFQPKIVLESDSPSTVRELIALGAGLCFIPKLTWAGIDYGPDVQLVRIAEPSCFRHIHMSWRGKGHVCMATELLRNYLKDFFAALELPDA